MPDPQDASPTPPMPRWVRIMIAAFLTLTVGIILVMVISKGKHGPGQHFNTGKAAPGSKAHSPVDHNP